MAAPRLNPSIIYCPISRYINPLANHSSKLGVQSAKTEKPKQLRVSISSPDKLPRMQLGAAAH